MVTITQEEGTSDEYEASATGKTGAKTIVKTEVALNKTETNAKTNTNAISEAMLKEK